jgi:hypothetical protein
MEVVGLRGDCDLVQPDKNSGRVIPGLKPVAELASLQPNGHGVWNADGGLFGYKVISQRVSHTSRLRHQQVLADLLVVLRLCEQGIASSAHEPRTWRMLSPVQQPDEEHV